MNRLIIIGNGFDLAHGLKSSSKDLILHYLINVWKKLSEGQYKDRLIQIERAKHYFQQNDLTTSEANIIDVLKKIVKDFTSGPDDAHMSFNSSFFESIFYKIGNLNWADFETEYFHELYDIIDSNNRKKNKTFHNRVDIESSKYSSIKKLNEDLDYIQDILIAYLKGQEEIFEDKGNIDRLYKTYFEEYINKEEVDNGLLGISARTLHFLNFNYTRTLEKYIRNSTINYIHGTLDDNPIFGFGDDTSDKYQEIENEYNNEFLRKIKSFKYLDNDNYKKLKIFVNSDDFDVQIFGHSCGVSDRTLFKQIFEDEHCKSIRIFYYNKNDFEEKKYELSRHFRNKITFLEKVKSFNKLRKMPQLCLEK
jgi:hypothetical protein